MMLQLKHLQLQLEHAAILNNVSADINAGELVVVLGPNGAGKSSFLKVASGELSPDSGEVNYCSQPMRDWSLLAKAKQCAVLAQNQLLDFPFTASEVVALGRTPHDTGLLIDNGIIKEALNLMGVGQLRHQPYTQLSGGEKQRVQLARVLAQVWQGRCLLLLDEPTAALDFSHQQQVMTIFKRKSLAGSAVLMVLHDLNLAASFADKIILMDQGYIKAVGTPEQVLQESLLEDVFKLKFHRVVHPTSGKNLFVS
tara:strand:- start:44898 stop:45659 length:762 start_codon:yes stop_codon:yes gene_type:complete